jgi:hypothetical protein
MRDSVTFPGKQVFQFYGLKFTIPNNVDEVAYNFKFGSFTGFTRIKKVSKDSAELFIFSNTPMFPLALENEIIENYQPMGSAFVDNSMETKRIRYVVDDNYRKDQKAMILMVNNISDIKATFLVKDYMFVKTASGEVRAIWHYGMCSTVVPIDLKVWQ